MTKRHDRASAAFEVGYERVSQSTVSTSASSLTADAGHQSASGRRLRNGQRLTTAQIILSGWSANRNVWSAASSQAKNEGDRLVCANVYGLHWSTKAPGLDGMRCALVLLS